jgi:hypothetical protein
MVCLRNICINTLQKGAKDDDDDDDDDNNNNNKFWLPINSSLLAITLHSSVVTTLAYNNKIFFLGVTTELNRIKSLNPLF